MIEHDWENNVLKTASRYDKYFLSYNGLKKFQCPPGTILNTQIKPPWFTFFSVYSKKLPIGCNEDLGVPSNRIVLDALFSPVER